jgi:type I restriction enzyme S subunit
MVTLWEDCLLSDVVRFGNGKAIKPGGTGLYPVFGSNGIIGGSDEFLHENGVVIGRVGAYCGAVVYCPTKFWASDNTLVAYPSSEQVDTQFLYRLLVDANLSRYAGGAAQPLVTQTVLKQVEVRIPELDVQLRIAGVLAAYDELIENSQRRIKILESMARALYREWFVYFRFPGHESVPLVPSALGDIPKGWELKMLGEVTQFKSGFAFKGGTLKADGLHRLVTIKNVQDGFFIPECGSRMNEIPVKMPSFCMLNDGDILLSLTGNVGRVCLVFDGPFLLNQRVSKLLPVEELDRAMVYCMFREPSMLAKLEQISNGVAQQNLSPIRAAQLDCIYPPEDLRQQFAYVAEPMFHRIIQLHSIIENLRRSRDLLLPRLLSGQIDLEAVAA